MVDLPAINEKVADDTVLNYATTHSTDRLSSVNLLKNTNWGLLLYVTSTEC